MKNRPGDCFCLIIAIIFSVLLCTHSSAQKNTLDSLNLAFTYAHASSESLRLLNVLTKAWSDRQMDSAFAINARTTQLAIQYGDTTELAMAYYLKAKLLAGIRRHDGVYAAYKECAKATALLQGNARFDPFRIWIESFANALVLRTDVIGYVLTNRNFILLDSTFAANLTRSKDYFVSRNDFFVAAMIMEDIVIRQNPKYGTLYIDLAEEYFSKAHFQDGCAKMIRYRGSYYWYKENYYRWYTRTFKTQEKSPYTYSINDKADAKRLWQASVKLAGATGNLTEMAKSLNGLAYYDLLAKNYQSTILQAQKALDIANQVNDVEQIMQYQQTFYDTYLSINQGDKALPYIEKYLTLKDSIIGTSSFDAITEMETRNKMYKQEQEVQQLKLKDIQSSGQRRLLLIGIGSLTLISLLITIIFLNRQRYLERIKKIELKSKLHEQKERLARDLHDSLGGQLSSISLGLNRLTSPNGERAIEAIQELAGNALVELRNSLWVMDKELISIPELEQRINGFFLQYRKMGTPIDLEVTMEEQLSNVLLSSSNAGHMFRIIQEAANNSLKHSKASLFKITLESGGQFVRMTIADNGVGFDDSKAQEGEHYGIKNMKQRASQMNAKIAVESMSGKGVKIMVELPIMDQERLTASLSLH